MQSRHRRAAWVPLLGFFLVALVARAAPARAAFTSAPIPWTRFTSAPGYISPYTYRGSAIADEETSADSSNGGTGVSPDRIDLSSGSPGASAGIYDTPSYGYYDGGTPYDPANPSTLNDDYLYFRMRLEGNPSAGGTDFDQYHWNILLDVDNDGYKEFWVDLNGGYGTGAYDQLQVLYDNRNSQLITDPAVSRVAEFQARNDGGGNSHTRVSSTTSAISPGDTDYYIEIQVPLTAFDDLAGNQVLFPDSPVSFVYSTGASNQDPLQKDFMMDLKYIGSNEPIQFGDTVKLNGEPVIAFTDATLAPTTYYDAGGNVYVYVKDRLANQNAGLIETLTVTVTDPLTGDDQTLTLCETGPDTGVFANIGATSVATSIGRANFSAWLAGLRYTETSGTPGQLSWRVRFDGANWIVESSPDGSTWTSRGTATPGSAFTYASPGGWSVSFTLNLATPKNATAGDTLTFTSYPGQPLPTSTTLGGLDGDGTLRVSGGETITFAYTPSGSSTTYTTDATIRAPCQVLLQFTRSTGLLADTYVITNDTATSDAIYVTAIYPEGNVNGALAETIQLRLASWNVVSAAEIAPPAGDLEATLTLTETGANTGVFRNAGLASRISDGTATGNDALWEDLDGGALRARYSYSCGGNDRSASDVARVFTTGGGGRVYLVNSSGTADVTTYGNAQYVYVKIVDGTSSACTYPGSTTPPTAATVSVTLSTPVGDSVTLTAAETAAGSGVYLYGSDTYQTVTYDGAYSPADNLLELRDGETIVATYTDSCDGDANSANNAKTDTGSYNAPPVVVNQVLFYPANNSGATCPTEFVQIFNGSGAPVNVTGYQITDGDAFSYTIPQFGNADIQLGAGRSVYVFLYPSAVSPSHKYDAATQTYYLFAAASGTTIPANELGDPGAALAADRADQILLRNGAGVTIDYVAWSATSTPSLDFRSDDTPAVSRSIWQDDAFRGVAGIAANNSISRSAPGYDTNQPADWTVGSTQGSAACTFVRTLAAVASLRAYEESGRTVVEWRTAAENGTAGFYLLRHDWASGEYVSVGGGMLPGLLTAPQGGVYRVFDDGAAPGGRYSYRLLEVEASGALIAHGPFDVRVTPAPPGGRGPRNRPLDAPYARAAHRGAAPATRAGRGAGKAAAGGTAALLEVAEDGLQRLDGERVAGLLGIPPPAAAKLIRSHGLSLSKRGAPVAYLGARDGSALWFVGAREHSVYTESAYYLLAAGAGAPQSVAAVAPGDAGAAGPAFRERAHHEVDAFAVTSLATDPDADYWFWEYVLAGFAGLDSRSFTLPAEGRLGEGTAQLSVALQGATEDGLDDRDHRARVSLNGTVLGEVRWAGLRPARATFSLPAALLRETDNTVEVRGVLDAGTPYSVFYVDGFDLEYPRTYRAVGDQLFFAGDGNAVVSVGGFSTLPVALYDVTDAGNPALVSGAAVDGVAGDYRLTFAPADPHRRYLAVAGPAVREPRCESFTPVGLASPENAADYLIVTVPELLEPSRALAEHRRRQGLLPRIVLVDEIRREFGFGYPGPRGLGSFLEYAARRWAGPPRYVLLVGDGTHDYRDRLGKGDNLVPPLLVPTASGLFPSDGALVDFDRDGVADLPIGRLPVTSAAELARVVDKIAAYESAPLEPWMRRVVLASDAPVPGADFPAQSAAAAALLPREYAAETVALGALPLPDARARLLDALGRGAFLLSYVGHGGVDRFSAGGLLTSADAAALDNAPRLPLVAAMTCVAGAFGIPGYDCLAEALLTAEGGAIAVWSPTGLSESDGAAALERLLFARLFGGSQARLGDALLAALRDARAAGVEPELLAIYGLVGDPALAPPR